MKAIPTAYKGYHFRSRLEARWAVFFDTLGLEWDYEPEGFELANGVKYLPDFYIQGNGDYGPYVEIKPKAPSKADLDKLVALCEEKCAYGLLFWGDPVKGGGYSILKEGFVEAEGSAAYQISAGWNPFDPQHHARLEDAVRAFRSARFEFGTSGASL
jgi:hypothetical protein